MAYESRKLKPQEKNYVVYDLELVVLIHALNMWRQYLLGNKFTLLIDHISLKYFFSQPDLNSRQARWMTFLSEFEFHIKHMEAKKIK